MRHASTRAEKQAFLEAHQSLWSDLAQLLRLAKASRLWACVEPAELRRSIATQLRACTRKTP